MTTLLVFTGVGEPRIAGGGGSVMVRVLTEGLPSAEPAVGVPRVKVSVWLGPGSESRVPVMYSVVCPAPNVSVPAVTPLKAVPADRGPAQRERHGHTFADLAHRAVALVGDVEVAGRVEGQAVGTGEPGGESADRPRGRHLAHRAVALVGDVEVAGCVEGQGLGMVEPGGEGADPPGGRHLAHRAVEFVGDVEIAGGVEGQGGGPVQPGGESADHPRGRHLAHRAGGIAGGDVEVAGGEGQAVGNDDVWAKMLTTPAGVTLRTVLPR